MNVKFLKEALQYFNETDEVFIWNENDTVVHKEFSVSVKEVYDNTTGEPVCLISYKGER